MLTPCCYATFNLDTRQASHDECISLALQSRKQMGLLERGKKIQRERSGRVMSPRCVHLKAIALGYFGCCVGHLLEGYPCLTHSSTPLPSLLALYQPMMLGRASQVSVLPLGPVTDDK